MVVADTGNRGPVDMATLVPYLLPGSDENLIMIIFFIFNKKNMLYAERRAQ